MSSNLKDTSNRAESKKEKKERAQRKKEFQAEREERLLKLFEKFNEEYPTDAACLSALCQGEAYPDGQLRCPNCKNLQPPGDFEARLTKCENCCAEIWITAQGAFRNTKKPRPWLAYAWLMDHDMTVNPNRFHTLLGIAASTAANIFKTITVGRLPVLEALKDNVESAIFKALYTRRSLETPANAHPVTEQEIADAIETPNTETAQDNKTATKANKNSQNAQDVTKKAASAVFPQASQVNGEDLSTTEKMILEKLSQDPIHIDKLCQMVDLEPRLASGILTTLELKGIIKRLPGDRYVQTEPAQFQAFNNAEASSLTIVKDETYRNALIASVNKFHDFIYLIFQGISRKYLELYLACFSIEMSNGKNGKSVIDSLRSTGPIPQKEIMKHCAPRLVRMPLAAS